MIGRFETSTGLTERLKSLGDILAGLCVNTVNKEVKKYLRSYNPKHTFKQQQTDLRKAAKKRLSLGIPREQRAEFGLDHAIKRINPTKMKGWHWLCSVCEENNIAMKNDHSTDDKINEAEQEAQETEKNKISLIIESLDEPSSTQVLTGMDSVLMN